MTPHSVNGVSPSELMLGRKLKSRLYLVRPCIASRVLSTQSKQKHYHDRHAKSRTIDIDDTVHVRNFAKGPNWLSG
ncbi:hypothetical protein LSH36_465g02052 [Paralvinella palmiformis]|uniref:Uncharacterized protein n=1 Tax=Paralvinella palmiformis TaxID=53620 RepID=A0AAD9MZW0_9ANNE|nr:hypothetical protein LSH36_465g02052 [Paralvinella palmiformis]